MKRFEVLFTPADFETLKGADLKGKVCVVFDVLRATSSMVTAFGGGAAAIFPVLTIADALRIKETRPEILLAGERGGFRILSGQTGGPDFDFGNSPREFENALMEGREIAWTTTNGTRALNACEGADAILISCFLNLEATASRLKSMDPDELVLVCGGTYEEAAYEDALCAGALLDELGAGLMTERLTDSALMALNLYKLEKGDLLKGISKSLNARRLLAREDLRDDVLFCAERDRFPLVAGSVGAAYLSKL